MHNILAALRAFRLLRIFKLASTWKKFSDLMKTVWKTLKDVSTFSLFLLLFLFIYALLGMELFAYGCKKTPDNKIDMVNGTYPLNNFNTFYEAMLTMFVLLTGDQWTQIMLDFYRSVSPSIAILFTISFMILGLYMLLNLFLAILLQNFDEDSIEEEMQKKLIRRHEIDKIIRRKKIERFFKRLLNAVLRKCCICFYKRIQKSIAVEENDEDLDPDKISYVDHKKSEKKAKGFLKHLKTANTGLNIKGQLIQMEGTSIWIFPV